tara:strand:+ start:69 stop:548 length:480 start_codon:yes stop_codon:yes gene_type:complete
MANKAIANISAKIFSNIARSGMTGSLTFKPPNSTEKWLYVSKSVTSSSANLIDTTYDYLGATAAVSLSDVVRWICIKNLSTSSTDGVAVCLAGGAAAYNGTNSMIIGSGEIMAFKCSSGTTFEHIHAISVTMDGEYGYVSGTNSTSVRVEIAAIADDIG